VYEGDVTVPAGWYPDPMGLPQLRWWNNQAWTELTTEARPPLVMQQPTRLLYADDELPTRRQQREQREREEEQLRSATDHGDARDAASGQAPFATTLREIDAPASTTGQDSVAPENTVAMTTPAVIQSDELDDIEPETAFDDIFQPRSATTAVSAPTAQNQRARTADPGSSTQRSALPRVALYTAPVWIIALLPLLQLVIGLLVLVGFGAVSGIGFTVAAFVGPYVAVVLLAIGDRTVLRHAGHERTAHWAWSFLSAPVYLIARSISLSRTGSLGLGPVLVWVALGMLQVASVLVVPGMLISVLPTVFSTQAEQSVASEAAIVGKLDVDCPTTPPVLIGGRFDCAATSDGQTYHIAVSLQRANGWIDWRVDDWGGFTPSR
jgi:hypothetical protein